MVQAPRHPEVMRSGLVDIAALGQQFPESRPTVGESGAHDGPGEFDAVLLGHLVQHGNRGAIAQQYALGVNFYGVTHLIPF